MRLNRRTLDVLASSFSYRIVFDLAIALQLANHIVIVAG